jgi:hypothetical protein
MADAASADEADRPNPTHRLTDCHLKAGQCTTVLERLISVRL